MKIIQFIVFSFLIISCSVAIASAKSVKPQVLVYGDNLEAFSAAMQSARSGVSTLWVLPTTTFYNSSLLADSSTAMANMYSVAWYELFKKQHVTKDTVGGQSLGEVQIAISPKILEAAISNQENLKVIQGVKVIKVSNNKKDIAIVLSDKQKFTFRAVVDASESFDLLKLSDSDLSSRAVAKADSNFMITDLNGNLLRTIVALGGADSIPLAVDLKSVLSNSQDNLFLLHTPSQKNNNHLVTDAFRFSLGQAVGATAAYCAFFKTSGNQIDVRKLQGELLTFNSRLLPFVDISNQDPNFSAIERIFLVNVLPWDKTVYPFLFHGSDSVCVEDVRVVMQQLYSRAQLWFLTNKSVCFSIRDVVELLKVVAFRGDELDAEIQKAWTRRFKFSNEFVANRLVSRYEFAVLLDAYASPFSKKINIEGLILK